MLRWRLLMSFFLIPLIVGLFAIDHRLGDSAPLLLAFCLLASLRCVLELTDLLTVRNLRPGRTVCLVLTLIVVASGWLHQLTFPSLQPGIRLLASLGWISTGVAGSFLVLLVREAFRFQAPGSSLESLGSCLITVCYCGLLPVLTAQLRWFPDPGVGYFALASMIICVKSGDTFAYAFGRLWGRRRMAPRLSPGKTWMGLAGAVAGATLGGWAWITFAGPLFSANPRPGSPLVVVVYSASMGLIGLMGDLCESLIKRDAGRKDAAALMPGFGGLLDLLDSPLFAGPFALAWWALLPPAIID